MQGELCYVISDKEQAKSTVVLTKALCRLPQTWRENLCWGSWAGHADSLGLFPVQCWSSSQKRIVPPLEGFTHTRARIKEKTIWSLINNSKHKVGNNDCGFFLRQQFIFPHRDQDSITEWNVSVTKSMLVLYTKDSNTNRASNTHLKMNVVCQHLTTQTFLQSPGCPLFCWWPFERFWPLDCPSAPWRSRIKNKKENICQYNSKSSYI